MNIKTKINADLRQLELKSSVIKKKKSRSPSKKDDKTVDAKSPNTKRDESS